MGTLYPAARAVGSRACIAKAGMGSSAVFGSVPPALSARIGLVSKRGKQGRSRWKSASNERNLEPHFGPCRAIGVGTVTNVQELFWADAEVRNHVLKRLAGRLEVANGFARIHPLKVGAQSKSGELCGLQVVGKCNLSVPLIGEPLEQVLNAFKGTDGRKNSSIHFVLGCADCLAVGNLTNAI